MTKQTTYGRLQAGLLALIFLASWALRSGHTLLVHNHAHHDVPVCTAEKEGHRTVHLHDERYQPDDCSVCAFLFATPELIPVVFALPAIQPAADPGLPHPADVRTAAFGGPVLPRGPPAA
ncbi:MAG: hypothetical protein IT260_02320 [Saprospiraceae bacterium]|nr:hypothetical protein [Saprospiraceae bacterium]